MKGILIFAPLILAASLVHAQDAAITGDWQGTLDAAGTKLNLVLHITKAPNNSLKATIDSLDQPGANGIPVSSVLLKDSKLSLGIEIGRSDYEAQVSADGNTITGTWTQQGQDFPLEFKRITAPAKSETKSETKAETKPEAKPAKPSDIDGAWMGTLDTGSIKLRVVFHILNTADGLTATMDSLDQGMNGLPTDSVARDGASLKIEAKKIGGAFDGTISADLASIDGKWSQGGGSLPLLLKRVKDQAELEIKRPQNPVKPYPYHDEEVSYDNKAQNVTLAATLTIPQGKGPFPAVVLITGSGPQDRDESLLGHKPFLVLSDYLTRHGIAVLRADDRGTAKSTGVFATATTADFATDTEAGIAYLKTRKEVDLHKIGLIGHSEGAVIAPMIAARNKDVAFIVMMAGTGVPGDQVLVAQSEAIQIANGQTPPDEAAKHAAREREMLTLVETEKDDAVLETKLKEKMAGEVPEAQMGMQIKQITSPWFRYFLTYDPAIALHKVTCSVLALNGSLDKQVLPSQNLPPIRKALAESGNPHVEVDELPGLNHLFQTAKTGSPAEYAQIEETISPVVLDKIATWILKQ
jgi:dienelactone hydrolase